VGAGAVNRQDASPLFCSSLSYADEFVVGR
jgi:hypothetical protein